MKLGEILQRGLVVGLAANHPVDKRDGFLEPRLKHQEFGEEHDRPEEIRRAFEHGPKPLLGPLQFPGMDVGLGRHGQGQEVVRLAVEEAGEDRAGFIVTALVIGDRRGVERGDPEAGLDRRQFGILGIVRHAQPTAGLRGQPENSRVRRRRQ